MLEQPYLTLSEDLSNTILNLLQDENSEEAIPTGIHNLDAYYQGGFKRGKVAALAGRPGMDRSGWAWSIAEHAASTGIQVLFFTGGVSRQYFIRRAIARMLGLDIWELRQSRVVSGGLSHRLTPDSDEVATYSRLSISIDDTPSLTSNALEARILDLNQSAIQAGRPLGLIVIDHLECLRLPEDKDGEAQLAETSMHLLVRIAKELHAAVIVTIPVSCRVEERDGHVPLLKDIWGMGHVEQIADTVIAIYNEQVYNPDCTTPSVCFFVLHNRSHISRGAIPIVPGCSANDD